MRGRRNRDILANMAGKGEMRITVWQFVRIMVALEGRRPRAEVYENWKGAWQELDAELTRLGKSDHAAYSDLMMNQEVVLELGGANRRRVEPLCPRAAKGLWHATGLRVHRQLRQAVR